MNSVQFQLKQGGTFGHSNRFKRDSGLLNMPFWQICETKENFMH